MKIALIITLYLFSAFSYAGVEKKLFNSKGLEILNLKNISGEVRVTVTGDEKANRQSGKTLKCHECIRPSMQDCKDQPDN